MSKTVPCPKCGTSVEGGTGFGMVACTKCGEFILMGEQPMEAMRDAILKSAHPSGSEENKVFEFSFDGDLSGGDDEGAKKTEAVSAAVDITVFSVDPSPLEVVSLEPQKTPEKILKKADEPPPTPPVGPSQFRDVVDFANLDQESTGTGGLVYDIVIKGIDTVETRQEIAACLGDKRLKLNADQLLKTIDAGELNLRELNPVRASVLIGVIKHLSLKVSWTSRQLIKGVFIFLILTGVLAHASDWARHEINLKGYATKIENMEEDIRDLLVKKNQNKDPQERDEILKEIIQKNKELKDTYKEFKKEKEHIRFEHPEQGDKTERKYKHVKLKSLDELEGEVGLQGQLSRIKKKVEATYPSANEENKDPVKKPSPAVETDQD